MRGVKPLSAATLLAAALLACTLPTAQVHRGASVVPVIRALRPLAVRSGVPTRVPAPGVVKPPPRLAKVDTTPPDIIVSGVADGLSYSNEPRPTARSTDRTARITATFNGYPYELGTPITGEGVCRLSITAVDSAGNASRRDVFFTTDRTPPELVVSGVADGRGYRGAVRPAVSSWDFSCTTTATLDGEPFLLGNTITHEGRYTLEISATDAAGNTTEKHIGFSIDRHPPDVRILGLAAGATYTIGARGTAVSNDPSATVAAELDGVPYLSGSEIASDGPHSLTATATDPAGNETTASVAFHVDRTPPRLAVEGIADGTITSATVTPHAACDDASATVSAALDGAPYLLGSPVSAEGTHVLVVSAVDPLGNASSERLAFTIDKTPPGVTISGVEAGGRYPEGVWPLVGTGDPSATVSAALDGGAFTSGRFVSLEGSHALEASATDPAGNVSRAAADFLVDRTAPACIVEGVRDSASYPRDVWPAFSSDERAVTFAATLDGRPFREGSAVSTEGAHTLVVVAADPTGNRTSRSLCFTIDRTRPDLRVGGAADGSRYASSVMPYAYSGDPSATVAASMDGVGWPPGAAVVAEGTHTVSFTSVDPAGNATSRSLRFHIDRTPPDLVVDGVADGARFRPGVRPSAFSWDPEASVSAALDGRPFALDTPVWTQGVHTLAVTAADRTGNLASALVTFVIDAVPPALRIGGVKNGRRYETPVTPVAWWDDEDVRVTATLNGVPFRLGTPVAAEGTYTLRVEARDAAGNASERIVRFAVLPGAGR